MDAVRKLDNFQLGDFTLQKGEVLRQTNLVYATYGELNKSLDNVIVYPTHYTGDHRSNENMIGPGKALDTDKYFVVVPNMFGNGLSTSPSNATAGQRGPDFPLVTVQDNVRAQRKLIVHLGIKRLALVYGWSMGGQQAFQWAANYPELVQRMICCCGSAKTSQHNWVFLEGIKTTLTACLPNDPKKGLVAFGKVYAGWAYSQAFFREQQYTQLGFQSAQELMEDWAKDHLTWDPYDLLAMLATWQHADISDNSLYYKDFDLALQSITANTLIMPGETDLYFHMEDNRLEVSKMDTAELRSIPSAWGHMAGSPKRGGEDQQFVEQAIRNLLDKPAQSVNI